MLVSSLDMLRKAQSGSYAIGAFNIENMEMAQAVIAAAESMNSPVIIQTTTGTLKYAKPAVYAGIVAALANAARVPVALHLDHGDSIETANACIAAGYTSIMIDGSREPLEENIRLTKAVTTLHPTVQVEGELGSVGGKEDDTEGGTIYTDPDEAARFVAETRVTSLAIGIGTAHGIYKTPPVLDVERVTLVRRKVSVPLVLHGTSGVPFDVVRDCVSRGMCKVNVATELRAAFTEAVLANVNASSLDPKKYLKAARESVEGKVREWIDVLGSEGRGR